jgi:1-deoxy-D-xylulose-5-phosphate reductoisomerase
MQLAWEVLAAPVGTTAVLNAANEIAVAAFLAKKIRFDQIYIVNRATLDRLVLSHVSGINDLLAIDGQARAMAANFARKMEI